MFSFSLRFDLERSTLRSFKLGVGLGFEGVGGGAPDLVGGSLGVLLVWPLLGTTCLLGILVGTGPGVTGIGVSFFFFWSLFTGSSFNFEALLASLAAFSLAF